MEHVTTHSEPDAGAGNERRRRTPRARSARATRGRAKGEKLDQRGRPTTGRVTRIQYGQGFGFIRADGRRDVFFHRKDVIGGAFNALAVDDDVVLELIEDPLTGPRAVRVAPRPAHSSAA